MKLIARHEGEEIEVEVERYGPSYRVRLGDRWILADWVSVGEYVHSLRLEDGTQYSVVHHRQGRSHEITLNGSTIRVEILDPLSLQHRREDETGGGGIIEALMPGRVVKLLVAPGEIVKKGASLLVLEAMKMQNEIQAPIDGTVEEIFIAAGDTVERGAHLLHLSS